MIVGAMYRSFASYWRRGRSARYRVIRQAAVVTVVHDPSIISTVLRILAIELDDGVLQVFKEPVLDVLEDHHVIDARTRLPAFIQRPCAMRRADTARFAVEWTIADFAAQLEHNRRQVLCCGRHDDLRLSAHGERCDPLLIEQSSRLSHSTSTTRRPPGPGTSGQAWRESRRRPAPAPTA